ncbi:amidohydrolase family protein [Fulvivirgaceae bacterium BMA10]|uniref:Amidohydrolase family protein n=1 Tax=Splendidivirga corallicola TaxID=3051826 RepID=A0ABT8KXA6_9BACT|nr:amidohydrolase family protein [Fulvivirgaceae bacterium BMA10]
MRIDSHQHFWNYDPVRDAWIDETMGVIRRDFTPNDLAPILQQNSFDGCIAVQADQSEDETDFLLGLAEKNDFIKGVVGWLDLRADNIEERLHLYNNRPKLVGIRHIVQSEPDDNFMLGTAFQYGIGKLKSFDLAYDILIFPKQLPAAIKLVEKFPDQKFVLDHIAKPLIKDRMLQPWKDQIEELAKAENVLCKVSGMVTEADWKLWEPMDFNPYLDVVFEAFGTDRLMFGSDWPVCLLASDYGRVVDIVQQYMRGFDKDDQEKVFGRNAMEFYGT